MASGFWGCTSYHFYINCIVKCCRNSFLWMKHSIFYPCHPGLLIYPPFFPGCCRPFMIRNPKKSLHPLWDCHQSVTKIAWWTCYLLQGLTSGECLRYQWLLLCGSSAHTLIPLTLPCDVCYVALGVWNVYLQPENKTFNKTTQLYSWKLELL